MKKLILILGWLLLQTPAGRTQSIFPGLTGQELQDSLRARYTPASVLNYNTARDKMYALIDNHGDSVRCVYTAYAVFVPHNAPNPRDYTNAANPIINAEHTWPKSKGASGPAKSNLHHLFPTNAVANSARASYPFGEIPDPETDKWYRHTQVLSQIPPSHIDEYSELDLAYSPDRHFEPREDHEGNAARAMFYFYTIYRTKADSADPAYFDAQKGTLRQWHQIDPPDSAEVARTWAIAGYQDGKPNPFVLDPTLVDRAYFPASSLEPPLAGPALPDLRLLPNYPNPFNPETVIHFVTSHSGAVRMELFAPDGRRIWERKPGRLPAGEHKIPLHLRGRASGVYLLRVTAGNRPQWQKLLFVR